MDFTLYEIELKSRLEKYKKKAVNYGVSVNTDQWIISKLTSDEINIIITDIDAVKPAIIIDTRVGYPFSFMFFDGEETFELAEASTTGPFKKLFKGLDVAVDWIISNSL